MLPRPALEFAVRFGAVLSRHVKVKTVGNEHNLIRQAMLRRDVSLSIGKARAVSPHSRYRAMI